MKHNDKICNSWPRLLELYSSPWTSLSLLVQSDSIAKCLSSWIWIPDCDHDTELMIDDDDDDDNDDDDDDDDDDEDLISCILAAGENWGGTKF